MHAALRAEAVREEQALLRGSKDMPPVGEKAPAAATITMQHNAVHLLCIFFFLSRLQITLLEDTFSVKTWLFEKRRVI